MARKRVNGEGSIYQRSDGVWKGALTVGYGDDGKPRRKTVTGKTAAEARIKLDAVRGQHAEGLPPTDDTMTLDQLFAEWDREWLTPRKSAKTRENYMTVARVHILARPGWSTKRVAKVNERDVNALQNAVAAHRGWSTTDRTRNVLSQAMDYAVNVLHVRPRNPVVAVPPVPKYATTRLSMTDDGTDAEQVKPRRSMTKDQAADFLDAAKSPDNRLGNMFTVALWLYLRPGEAAGILWDDVDLKGRKVHIRQAAKVIPKAARAAGGPTMRLGSLKGEPRNTRSRRTLDLPDPVVAAFKAQLAEQAREKLAAPAEYPWPDTGLVFTSDTGTILDPANARHALDRLTEDAGLGTDWTPYELRHTGISLALAAGVPLQVVSTNAGHASIRMTADVYGHVQQSQTREAADLMAAFLNG